jgi:hypothetical protein
MILRSSGSSIAAISLVLLLVSFPLALFADDNKSDVPGMKPEWLACADSDDCGLTSITCGYPLPANKKYLTEAHDAFCASNDACMSTNCPRPPKAIPVCENNQCTAKNTNP